MNDFKSKLPDFKEISTIACKLFKDVKQSVSEIISDYKKKREDLNEEIRPQQTTTKPKDETVVVSKVKKSAKPGGKTTTVESIKKTNTKDDENDLQ